MKIENKDFWEREDVIHSQDKTVGGPSGHEAYLYKKTKSYFNDLNVSIKKAKIFGCGTGREINGILKYLSIDSILATDISENMIKKGKQNIISWNLQDKVELQVVDATKFIAKGNSYELVTLMNSMLTYVKNIKDRYTIFKTAHDILIPKGVLIGEVHNQVGTPQKTIYFLLRRILKPFIKNEPGNRVTGFYGFDVGGYYFTKKDLHKHLSDNGFVNIEIKSLSEYSKEINIKYNRLKGYNNLIFFASKP
jgi:ubiquinone/menaquinone biosynthesis C-methylase UbiE